MTKLLNRLFLTPRRQPAEYHYLLHSPAGCFVSLALATAVDKHATRITYGLPPGISLNEEDKAKIRADYDETQKEISSMVEIEKLNSFEPVRFRRRDELPVIPCWHEVDGRWARNDGDYTITWCYACVPQILADRLVSIDEDRPPEGGTEEWIEYSDPRSRDVRHFVRIRLWFEENNSITVDLLETRTLQKDATVWWRLRRV